MDLRAVAEERPRAGLLRRFLRDLGLFMLIASLNSVIGYISLLLGRSFEVIPAWLFAAPQALATVLFVWFFFIQLGIRSGPSR
jgi:hypothetical protein